ncbi:MAG: LysR substrate-binding domain-containing protein [Steroidobacteraceae bacterium]|jgi:LysR family glycine cleavage system transcriptional activator
MRKLPPLSSLRAFEAAARQRSFKQAASELGVTPTAISHQIKTLEAHLGVELFVRHVRRVELTAAALGLYATLREGFDHFAAAIDQIAKPRRRPVVKISATTAFTARWLLPRVKHFQDAYPDIDLQLHASDHPVDLDTADVDFAIRYGRGPYPGLLSEVLFADRFAPVANPSLGIHHTADLQRLPLIDFDWLRVDSANPTWETWFKLADQKSPGTAPRLRLSDESHAIQAAVAGQGVALLSLTLVRDEIEAGRLVQPFGPVVDGFTYHLVEQAHRRKTEPVEAARAWVMAEVRSTF